MLDAHQADNVRAGPHPPNTTRLHRAREVRVLSEEAVSRVDERHCALLADRDDSISSEVRGGLRGAHGERRRLVGEQDVRRERIGGRVDRDGAQAEAPRRLDDAHPRSRRGSR